MNVDGLISIYIKIEMIYRALGYDYAADFLRPRRNAA